MSATEHPHEIASAYDLIFAGGGTTALITATRLASAFPDLSIAVLESGPSTRNKPEHTIPGYFVQHLFPDSSAMQFTTSAPSPHVLDRPLVVPSGRCVGGGSAVNVMMYNRPAASDFDAWQNEFGNAGWGSRDLIPLLQKAETYELDPPSNTHGSTGPLRVSFGSGEAFDLGAQFLDVGSRFENGRPRGYAGNEFAESDINQFYQLAKWMSKDAVRSDVAHHYFYNKHLLNISVFDGCRVSRVLIENGTATGVEYLFDKATYPAATQSMRTVMARKLVVVSAGALNSPLILERSGIGRRDVLERAGVELVVDLPGVGENYHDHVAVFAPYFADPATKTLDPLIRRDPEAMKEALEQYERNRTGILATNGVDGGIKLRPHPSELPELGPVFQKYWDETLAAYPDKPLFFFHNTACLPMPGQPGLPPTSYMTSGVFLTYPASRGHLHIRSTDVYAEPDFVGGYLSKYVLSSSSPRRRRLPPLGVQKVARGDAPPPPAYRGPLLPAHPQFAASSAAAWPEGETGPVPLDAPKFVYTEEDDAAIDLHTRAMASTVWHSLGTCAMKPREQGGVVDSKLNVYGIKNLKIADVSIPPSNVHANTCSTAIAIGEKAAVIIAEELGGSL
ncbi:GMC oxidoreductase [Mycena kentingensis (nom. inval.)]|nr:GMC oxidoreductase [Mycena kentingensis (nom. inval.)]